MDSEKVKDSVRDKYGKIAKGGGSCCTDSNLPTVASLAIGCSDGEMKAVPEGAGLLKEPKGTFSIEIDTTDKRCPVGEEYAERMKRAGKIPVFSCEGGCIRGEIARLAANMVAKEEPYARACHAETFTIAESVMHKWVQDAPTVVMIDGCFLKCHDRILKNIIDEDKIIHFDALSHYKKYTDLFDIDSVPEEERKSVGREVSDWVLNILKDKLAS